MATTASRTRQAATTATAPRQRSAAELLGLPPPPRTGRDRLVAAAIDLFYRRGFGAVGIEQVIVAAGVTKSTFYKHFESKDDLMVAAVRRRDEWETLAWGRAVAARLGDTAGPAERVLAMFDVLDEWFNAPDFRGCIFTNAATEFPNPHDPVHQAAAVYKLRVRQGWVELCRSTGATAATAESFADCLTALLEGAMILRQAYSRNDAARAVRPAVAQLLAANFAAC